MSRYEQLKTLDDERKLVEAIIRDAAAMARVEVLAVAITPLAKSCGLAVAITPLEKSYGVEIYLADRRRGDAAWFLPERRGLARVSFTLAELTFDPIEKLNTRAAGEMLGSLMH